MSNTFSQFFSNFTSIIKNKSTGVLKIQSGSELRLCMFSKGICIDVGSNIKNELPGTFLFEQKLMSTDQYKNYIEKYSAPKTNQWLLANSEIKLSPEKIFDLRQQLAKKIISNIEFEKTTGTQFQSIANLSSDKTVIDNLSLFIALTSKIKTSQIQEFKPELADGTTLITIIKKPQKDILSDDLSGLFTVTEHNPKLSDLLDSSFLEKEKIYQCLLAFEIESLILIESQEAFNKRMFFEAFTLEQKKQRAWLIKELERVNAGNFYEILGIETGSDSEDIQEAYKSNTTRFSLPEFNNLFYKDEENPAHIIVQKIKHANTILFNSEKRKEYDTFLKKGAGSKFMDHSQVIQEEKTLTEFRGLVFAGKTAEALDFVGQKISEFPHFIKLYSALVDLVKTKKLISDETLNQKIFNWFKLGIAENPNNSQIFSLLGEWCFFLSQKNNALKAFQKALNLDAGSEKLRNYVLQLDPQSGKDIIVEAVYQNLGKLNHFEILGIKPTATSKEIHETYRNGAKNFHPDKFFNHSNELIKDKAKKVYKEMAASYLILKDEQKRKDFLMQLFSSQQKKDEKEKIKLPTSLQAKKYYDQAVMFVEKANYVSAKLNIQLALGYEPDNYLLQKMLKDVQSKLPNSL